MVLNFMDELQENIKKLTELIEKLKFINKEIRYTLNITDNTTKEVL